MANKTVFVFVLLTLVASTFSKPILEKTDVKVNENHVVTNMDIESVNFESVNNLPVLKRIKRNNIKYDECPENTVRYGAKCIPEEEYDDI
ncbi:hypothetical protein B5X24_HaOG215154 [Helicoverpa armigera]|nr:hypothetical protein B5X24_HaOG215154 [Helicoverpa armigera]